MRASPLPLLTLLLSAACAPALEMSPPDDPPHTDVEGDWVDGQGYVEAAHARGKDVPFLCRDPDSGAMVSCPSERPANAGLSCDAAGCHGDTEFGVTADEDRHLDGSDGPSCWLCHDREWSSRTTR